MIVVLGNTISATTSRFEESGTWMTFISYLNYNGTKTKLP